MLKFISFVALLIYTFSCNSCFGICSTKSIINKPSFDIILNNKKQRIIIPKKSSLVLDCSNLRSKPIILHQQSANEIRHPASLTKMMTIYLLLEAVQKKKVTFNTKFTCSKLASRQMPSKLNLLEGERISVLECIKALLVKSANDVAVVVAEGLCGSVSAFCKLMNKKAKSLGMKYTHYENPSGVPNTKQVTCANDVAILGLSMMKQFAKYWYLFSTKSFTYKNKTYNTHCKILRWYNGADGAKTGYICASGFNLWVTATKYNKDGKLKRLCAIIFGEHSGRERDFKAARLMDSYFKDYNIINNNVKNECNSKCSKKINTNNSKTNENYNIVNNLIKKKQCSNIQSINKNNNIKTDKLDKIHVSNIKIKPVVITKDRNTNNTNIKSITNNTKLQKHTKHNEVVKDIDKRIDNVLNTTNNKCNKTNVEEEVIYEFESFPMDDIIKSSGKSKEYFDDLYKDDIPLQIESATPIDFSVPKKSPNKSSNKAKNKTNQKKSNNNNNVPHKKKKINKIKK